MDPVNDTYESKLVNSVEILLLFLLSLSYL